MSDSKKKIEAVLFSAGKKLSMEELAKLCRIPASEALERLEELKKEYDEKLSSLMIVNEDNFWKFTVREQFLPVVRKVVTETELSKSILETLAVIAFKYPILQSELIKIRTNKAYEHLSELENSGYISRKKKGRTNLIMLTDKFFEYFDLPPDKLKHKFKDFEAISKAIEEKEWQVKEIKLEQKRAAEEAKQQDEKIRKEIEELDKAGEVYEIPLEVYGSKADKGIESELVKKGILLEEEEKLGELEITEMKQKKQEKKDLSREKKQDETKSAEKGEEKSEKKEEKKLTEEDIAVEKEIEKILHPNKEEENKKEEEEG